MACSFICKSEVYGASQFLWAMTQTPIEGQWGMTRGPPRICPSQLSLLRKKERAGLYPVGWTGGGEDKEHSREMALVKDWHRPPHWDVNLNRGSVGWGLSYSCWWDSRGFRAPRWCGWTGVGHDLMLLRASSHHLNMFQGGLYFYISFRLVGHPLLLLQ